MKIQPYVIERNFNAPVEKVWKAITNKNEMRKWYFDLAEFEPKVGLEFQFKAGKEDKLYLHFCKITEVVKNKKLSYSWRYDGYPGISYVTFELFHKGSNTLLRLTHEGLESFGTENPDLAKERFAEGWEHIIGKSLKEFLEK
jgi:uncharacterized protein YndB with AHSA1/START domain